MASVDTSYQDNPYVNFRKHLNIPAELASVRPYGDLVLVRVVPEPDMHANLIWLPETRKERGYQPPRIGEVVAVGPGDRCFAWLCLDCTNDLGGKRRFTWTTTKSPKCAHCGGKNFDFYASDHHSMYVKPGDKIVFWRVLANGVTINDEHFQLIHEEQILAVLEVE